MSKIDPGAALITQHHLVREHRRSSDCLYSLSVAFGDPPRDELIRVQEFYDYLPRGDDDGREYGYTLKIERGELTRLRSTLEARSGRSPVTDNEEAAVLDCLRRLVEGGQLTSDVPRGAYCIVRGWLDEAGIAYGEDDWFWFNS